MKRRYQLSHGLLKAVAGKHQRGYLIYKEINQPKMNIQTCKAFYLVLNTKDILKNVWVQTTLTVNSIDKKNTDLLCFTKSYRFGATLVGI